MTVREHLTECLKNAIKPYQVNIGKTKDEMGKGIEVGNSKSIERQDSYRKTDLPNAVVFQQARLTEGRG